MLFADADSLRISPREARSLIEQAEKRQKDAQNADKKAADMLAEYERRKGILDTRLSELEKNGGAALAVLDAQQARLLGQQTRNDRAISEARNKLSSVTESLNTARNALTVIFRRTHIDAFFGRVISDAYERSQSDNGRFILLAQGRAPGWY
ncbi:hypothetical protein J4Y49_25950, partial [Escherichia coli]